MIVRDTSVKEIRFKRSTISYVDDSGKQIFKNEIFYQKVDGGIGIGGNHYTRLPREIFKVYNGSDPMRDYFEDDRTFVSVDHPAYPWVYLGWLRQQVFRTKDINLEREMKKYKVGKFDDAVWNQCVEYIKRFN